MSATLTENQARPTESVPVPPVVTVGADVLAAESDTALAQCAVMGNDASRAMDEAVQSGDAEAEAAARYALDQCKSVASEIRSGRASGSAIAQKMSTLRTTVQGAVHQADDSVDDSDKKKERFGVIAEQQAEKKTATSNYRAPKQYDDHPDDIIVIGRRPKKATQVAERDEDDYVGTGKARRVRKATSAGGKVATSVLGSVLGEDLADEVVSTGGTAVYTVSGGAAAIAMGDTKASDKAAQATGRGVRNVIRDVGVDSALDTVGEYLGTDKYLGKSAVAETVGHATHNVLWGAGRVGTAVSSVTVAPVVKAAGSMYEGGKSLASSAWGYFTGEPAKAAEPPKPAPVAKKGSGNYMKELNELRGFFEKNAGLVAKYDADKDGKVELHEIANRLKTFGITNMSQVDSNRDGDVTMSELAQACSRARTGKGQQH